MLKAIGEKKLSPWTLSTGEKISATDAYRDLEDHVTAAVFARLSYLPDDMVWSILYRSILLGHSSRFDARPHIKAFRFWPVYTLEASEHDSHVVTKEPDVVIETSSFTWIIEAKRFDDTAGHTLEQIRNEIAAYRNHEFAHDKPVCMLLMGGRIPEDIAEAITDCNTELRYLSWHDLRRNVNELRKKIPSRCGLDYCKRTLSDIDEALQLHGVIRTVAINDFPSELVNVLASAEAYIDYLAHNWSGIP